MGRGFHALLRRRDQIAGAFALGCLFAATSGGAIRHTIVDGRETVRLSLFGHFLTQRQFLVTAFPLLVAVYAILLVIGDRVWREGAVIGFRRRGRGDAVHMETFAPPQEAPRPFGIDGPEEFVQAKAPQDLTMTMAGWELDEGAISRFFYETEVWLEQASDDDLRRLVPIALETDSTTFDEMDDRLCESYESRGIPTLGELAAYAERAAHSWLGTYVASRCG